jgi:uncharacterized protein (TIGR02265 family)
VLDAARFPSLSAYVAALPAGLASYPECVTKGALVRSILDEVDLSDVPLPTELAAMVRERPLLTAWVSAVHADAMFHVYCDLHARTDQAMLEWTYERSARVGRSQAYRHLLAVAGPRMLLRTSVRMHGLFQRGTEIELAILGEKQAELVLTHPPHLHSRLNQLSNVALLRAVVDVTGGKETACEMTAHDARTARYVVRWK